MTSTSIACQRATARCCWKFKTNGPVHSTPGIADGMAFIAGCDELFRAIRISDGKEVFNVSSGAYTGASPALRGGSAFYGTFDNEVLELTLAERKIAWRYEHPQRKVSLLLVGRSYEHRESCSVGATRWSMD